MKNVFLSLALVFAVSIVFADNDGKGKETKPAEQPASVQMISVSGQVLDINTGEALTGVEVELEGTGIKTYSDFDGNFSFDNIIPGKYNVIASLISYRKSLLEDYKLDGTNKHVDIKLEISK